MSMTPETLHAIKSKLQRFLPIVEKISNYWQYQPHYTLLYVLVQNLVHDASDCVGYDHNAEVAKIREILSILKSIAEYHNSYYESYVYNEVKDYIDGIEMAEGLDMEHDTHMGSNDDSVFP